MSFGASFPSAFEHLTAAFDAAPAATNLTTIAEDCAIECKANGCYISVSHQNGEGEPDAAEATKDEYMVVSLAFAEGRDEGTHDQLVQALQMHPSSAAVKEVMLDVVEQLVPERAMPPGGIDRSRGPLHYMLHDDEEIETLDDGRMDGSLALRRSCPAWQLTVLATASDIVVYFAGSPFGDDEGSQQGGAYVRGGSGWYPVFAVGDHVAPTVHGISPVNPDVAKIVRQMLIILGVPQSQ